jgi:anti-sigma B factor antagonist
MEIITNKNGETLELAVKGRVDTTTSPELEARIEQEREGVTKIVFDFTDLEYISSAGLRVLLKTAQSLDDMDDMVVKNVNSDILDIFEVTGFTDILNIE